MSTPIQQAAVSIETGAGRPAQLTQEMKLLQERKLKRNARASSLRRRGRLAQEPLDPASLAEVVPATPLCSAQDDGLG